jgi:glycosyltransferase involved in cell wall biosynthesis
MTGHGGSARAGLPRIGILDPCCAAPYGPASLTDGGLGGTEATVLRVALALRGAFAMRLFQKPRGTAEAVAGLDLAPAGAALRPGAADAFLVINSWKVALRLRRAHPHTPIGLWLHVFPGRHNRAMGPALAGAGIGVTCVSASHARALRGFAGADVQIGHVWNPLAPGLVPDATPRDPDLLLFASAPHKGLAEVYARFRTLRARLPSLRLEVADPGYLAWDAGTPPAGVRPLGTLRHADLVARMRRALCLFYPQTRFAETFGLVMAEANAVGTPVLVQAGLGANDEVVADPAQRIDATDDALIAARIAAWRAGYPSVSGNPGFALDRVAQDWRRLLEARLAARQAVPA